MSVCVHEALVCQQTRLKGATACRRIRSIGGGPAGPGCRRRRRRLNVAQLRVSVCSDTHLELSAHAHTKKKTHSTGCIAGASHGRRGHRSRRTLSDGRARTTPVMNVHTRACTCDDGGSDGAMEGWVPHSVCTQIQDCTLDARCSVGRGAADAGADGGRGGDGTSAFQCGTDARHSANIAKHARFGSGSTAMLMIMFALRHG